MILYYTLGWVTIDRSRQLLRGQLFKVTLSHRLVLPLLTSQAMYAIEKWKIGSLAQSLLDWRANEA